MSLGSLTQGAGEALVSPARAVSRALGQRATLSEDAHRPWPLPDRGWFMGQTWEDLLFAHWRVAAEELERVVPAKLRLDRFEGECWVGVTPFAVRALRLRGTAPVPVLSSFPEVNVRTYVRVGDRPGIYFLSLDADSRSAVWSARRAYRLPYFKSAIATGSDGAGISYRAQRTAADGPAAELDLSYRAVGPVHRAASGDLDHWLTERYCLYTLDEHGTVLRGEIHHPPWPLQAAEAQLRRNTMAKGFGLRLEGEPVLHFAARQDVVLWTLEPAR